MQTRSFLLVAAGVERFIDVSWEGLRVEVATGVVGQRDAARSRRLANAAARDAFVQDVIAKAIAGGFTEVDPSRTDVPPAIAVVPPAIERFRRAVWIPRFEPGEGGPHTSKIGGTPWLSPDDEPGEDEITMPLLLQLAVTDVPELGLGPGLFQIFWDADDESYDDWLPWTPTKEIRIVQPVGEGIRVPMEAPWSAHRIVGFERATELPDFDTLCAYGLVDDLDEGDSLFELLAQQRPRDGTKLGGWPRWVHDIDVPRCAVTGLPCDFVLQLDSDHRMHLDFGGGGIGYVWRSPIVRDRFTMTWQR